jgi:hypothetical protein
MQRPRHYYDWSSKDHVPIIFKGGWQDRFDERVTFHGQKSRFISDQGSASDIVTTLQGAPLARSTHPDENMNRCEPSLMFYYTQEFQNSEPWLNRSAMIISILVQFLPDTIIRYIVLQLCCNDGCVKTMTVLGDRWKRHLNNTIIVGRGRFEIKRERNDGLFIFTIHDHWVNLCIGKFMSYATICAFALDIDLILIGDGGPERCIVNPQFFIIDSRGAEICIYPVELPGFQVRCDVDTMLRLVVIYEITQYNGPPNNACLCFRISDNVDLDSFKTSIF